MTEAEQVFHETNNERKRNGWGANNKVRGGGRYVRTPSDNLTKAEREALNGECQEWNMRAFYTWDEFFEMPDDIQIQYINGIINRYGVGITSVSKIVFNKNETMLYTHFYRKGLTAFINKTKGSNGKDRERLKQDVAKAHEEPRAEQKEEPQKEAQQTEPQAEPEAQPTEQPTVNSGANNLVELLNQLKALGATVTIQITL